MYIFDIKVLESDWVDITEESIQYNEVSFSIESLKRYDGKSVEVLHDWKIRIWDDVGNVIEEFFLIENEEFKRMLYGKYPLK